MPALAFPVSVLMFVLAFLPIGLTFLRRFGISTAATHRACARLAAVFTVIVKYLLYNKPGLSSALRSLGLLRATSLNTSMTLTYRSNVHGRAELRLSVSAGLDHCNMQLCVT